MNETTGFFLKKITNYTDAVIVACKNGYAVIGDPAGRLRFQALNPSRKLLIYRDVRTTRAVINDLYWRDYEIIKQWIVKDATGELIFDKANPYQWLLDLTNAACQNHIAVTIAAGVGDYAGVYLDEASAFSYAQKYSAVLPQSILDGWRQGMNETIRKIKALKPAGKILVGNVGNVMRSLSSCKDLDYIHDETTLGIMYDCT